jgi:alanine racemase
LDYPLIWAEVDLSAIAHNVRELRRVTHAAAKLMAVVKADGYGHGCRQVACTALANGATSLGVARIDEALQLRKDGFEAPILIFGFTPPAMTEKLLDFRLTQTIFSKHGARAWSEAAQKHHQRIKVHVKVDTGMGRLGLLPDSMRPGLPLRNKGRRILDDIKSVLRLPGLEVEGIFTHFASADSKDKSSANKQLILFKDVLEKLGREGVKIPVKHAANSAAVIDLPDSHLDMVRPGIALYGLYPSLELNKNGVELKQAMTLKARVVHVKQVPAGFNISYGETYQTKRPTTIATISAGYADGFNRLLSSCGHVLIHGQKAPIVGRICMDSTMVDVGHIPQTAVFDEAVLFGRQKDAVISADDLAKQLNTINYEVVSTLTGRVSRVYRNGNRSE